jgi:hypothetical protein
MFTPVVGNYGYGWFGNKQFNRLTIFHPGGVPGSAAMITRYPEEKLLIVVLSNLENSRIIRASNDLAAIVLGEKYDVPKVRTAITISAKVLGLYAGDYESSNCFKHHKFQRQAAGSLACRFFCGPRRVSRR